MNEKRTGLWFLLACLAWCALYVLTPLLHAVALEKGWMPWSLNLSPIGVCVLACVLGSHIVLIVHTLVLVSKRKRLSAEVAQADTLSPEKLPWTIRTLRGLVRLVFFCLGLWIIFVGVWWMNLPFWLGLVLFCILLFVVMKMKPARARKGSAANPAQIEAELRFMSRWGYTAMLFVVVSWTGWLLLPALLAGRFHAFFLPLMAFCLLLPVNMPKRLKGRSNDLGIMLKKLFLVAVVHIVLNVLLEGGIHAATSCLNDAGLYAKRAMLLQMMWFCLVLGFPCTAAMTVSNDEEARTSRLIRLLWLAVFAVACVSSALLDCGITICAWNGTRAAVAFSVEKWQNSGLIEAWMLLCMKCPAGWTGLAIVKIVSMLAYFCIGLKVVGFPSCGKWTKASLAAGWLLVAVVFCVMACYGIAQKRQVDELAVELHEKCKTLEGNEANAETAADDIEFQYLENPFWMDWAGLGRAFMDANNLDSGSGLLMMPMPMGMAGYGESMDNGENEFAAADGEPTDDGKSLEKFFRENGMFSMDDKAASIVLRTWYPSAHEGDSASPARRRYSEMIRRHFQSVVFLLGRALFCNGGQDVGLCMELLEHDIHLLEHEMGFVEWKICASSLELVEKMFKEKDMISSEHGLRLKRLKDYCEENGEDILERIRNRIKTNSLPCVDAAWRDYAANRMDAQRGLPSPNLCQAFSLDALVTWNISFRTRLAKLVRDEDFPDKDDKFDGLPLEEASLGIKINGVYHHERGLYF